MNKHFQTQILQSTKSSALIEKETIQELWSGYGKIKRFELKGSTLKTVIVKHVQLPKVGHHPRGWNTDIGHQRKVKSYQVETNWYQNFSRNSKARVPDCLLVETADDEVLMVLEDLDAAGFYLRKRSVDWETVDRCLEWLAKFHANFLGQSPTGLWEVGTYWHLATRPQEWEVLDDQPLKDAAAAIDQQLNSCTYQTFVHGDAKLANFCFSPNGQVAGVDFQYVGGGCGMKDVAYFVGSCLNEKDAERLESKILDTYFTYLHSELETKNDALETEWRSLYRVAWADFHRFLKGWSPGHWKINGYSERVTREVVGGILF